MVSFPSATAFCQLIHNAACSADLETIYWTPHTPVKIVKQLRAILSECHSHCLWSCVADILLATEKEHVSAAMVSDKQLQDISERCAGDLRYVKSS